MEQNTEKMLNRFLQILFNGNAVLDNVCYNLKHKGYARLESAIHGPVAHLMGAWADQVSDLMDELGGRPVRYALPDNIEELSPEEALGKVAAYFDDLGGVVAKAVVAAEESGELEVKVFLEDFALNKVAKYRKQAHEWLDAVNRLGADTLNVHIGDYTSYIS